MRTGNIPDKAERNKKAFEALKTLPKEALLDRKKGGAVQKVLNGSNVPREVLGCMCKLVAADTKIEDYATMPILEAGRAMPGVTSTILKEMGISAHTIPEVEEKSYSEPRRGKKIRSMSTKEKVKRFKMGDTASIRFERLHGRLESPDFPVAARPAPTELRALLETVVAMGKKWGTSEIHLTNILGAQPMMSAEMTQTISFGIAPPRVDLDPKKRCK